MYGTMSYQARQYVAFGQLTWNKARGRNDLLAGLTGRFTSYDDNTPATAGTRGPGSSRDFGISRVIQGDVGDSISVNGSALTRSAEQTPELTPIMRNIDAVLNM